MPVTGVLLTHNNTQMGAAATHLAASLLHACSLPAPAAEVVILDAELSQVVGQHPALGWQRAVQAQLG